MAYQVNYLLQEQEREFVNDKGDIVKYSKLHMSGVVAGELIEIDLNVDKSEKKLVRLLLNAAEDVNVAARAGADELIPPVKRESVYGNGKTILDDEE